jgi:peptidylprolyl isomerase
MRHFALRLTTFALVPFILFVVACGGDDSSSDTPVGTPATGPNASGSVATPRPSAAAGAATGGLFNLENATTTPSGLKYIDEVVGTGESPRIEQSVTVNYTGKLASDGKVFDSTAGRQPATFALRQVIAGFSEGILGMKAGGKRTILIPGAQAYGSRPPPGSGIPPNADLIFEIELISFR